jgi:predicted metal-binding membrane protein
MATVVLLVVVPLVCWAWVVAMARDMNGPMTGASRWMMTANWDGWHQFLLWAMWAAMMTGMMLPSAAPTILIHGSAVRRRSGGAPAAQIYPLAAGYVAMWALFSVAATGLQRVLSSWLLLTPMMETSLRDQ